MTALPKGTFSRKLRRRSTYSEKIAWNILRGRRLHGLKFRRQYPVRDFVLDFYCFEHKLAIEVDGSAHDVRKKYDAHRRAILERDGISFIRINADDLIASPESLAEMIGNFIVMKRA
jgi:very-short-patch-repair endonuclease